MNVFRAISITAAMVAVAVNVQAELANGIKAVVHDSVITYLDVEDLTAQTAEVLRRQYRTQPEEFAKKMDEARGENLEKLLSRELILQDFKTAGYNLPESVIEELVQERIHAKYGDRATLTKTLQAEGITYEKFRQQVREQFIVEALRQKNISAEIIISPHKIETYYLAHSDDFKVEDEVKLRMIVLEKSSDPGAASAKGLAQEILGKLKEGATFAEMATIHSSGSKAKQGGDWGWVERSVLRKELADIAFTLKAGELSGVIETPEACYLMLVEDTRSSHTKSLGEMREQIEKNLLLEERNRLEKQWIDKLKKKTFFRYF
jgi:peptidyl-prolyl cis-trans isomerase SurA